MKGVVAHTNDLSKVGGGLLDGVFEYVSAFERDGRNQGQQALIFIDSFGPKPVRQFADGEQCHIYFDDMVFNRL